MQSLKPPRYLSWLNRIIIFLLMLNVMVISSFPGSSEIWSELSAMDDFCEINYCGFINFFIQQFMTYVAYAVMLVVFLKEWFVKDLSTRIKLNTMVFSVTFTSMLVFFVLFYNPIDTMAVPV